jgi:hypothetical protein
MEGAVLQRGDTRGILPAMLQYLQAVIQQLVDGGLRYDAENTAHGSIRLVVTVSKQCPQITQILAD